MDKIIYEKGEILISEVLCYLNPQNPLYNKQLKFHYVAKWHFDGFVFLFGSCYRPGFIDGMVEQNVGIFAVGEVDIKGRSQKGIEKFMVKKFFEKLEKSGKQIGELIDVWDNKIFNFKAWESLMIL